MVTNVKIISKNKIYSNNIFEIQKNELMWDQQIRKFDIIKHNGAVSILALENKDVVMIEQYRPSIEDYILEIPAGTIEKNEKIKQCAIRELEEETCYKAKNIIHMISYYSSIGYSTELIHCYVATGIYKNSNKLFTSDEIINIKKIRFKTLLEMIQTNRIKDSKTIRAILFYNQFSNQVL